MLLSQIAKDLKLEYEIISNNSKIEIKDIVLSSKEATKNNAFTAIKGFKSDGHKYIAEALTNHCRNFIVEAPTQVDSIILSESTIIKVKDSRLALALISNYLNDYPSDKLKMAGITGTKGKTTVSTLLHHLLSVQKNVSLFTTVKNIVAGEISDSERTTMEANKLQKLLKDSVAAGSTTGIVEVSSHAVTLKRIEEINWDIGIFTNFSRDHLDLYETMENYFEAKLDFFRALSLSNKKDKFAVINMIDPKGFQILKVLDKTVRKITVGTDVKSTYKLKKHYFKDDLMLLEFYYSGKKIIVASKLKGEFNVLNILTACAAAHEMGLSFDEINEKMLSFKGVEGRFEEIVSSPYKVIIDYAHTPDSIEKILKEGRLIAKNKVIIVFGCTGDRDKEKRPIMGEIAAKYADFTIITNDDTYTENPDSIAHYIAEGVKKTGKTIDTEYKIILDRQKAIKFALDYAGDGDVIILAGMGHEKHQIIGYEKIPHSDKETVLKILNKE